MKRFLVFVFCAAVLFGACQKEPSLTLSGPTSVELSADGGSGSASFTVNRDWTASASDSWVSVSPSSGSASDGPVTVTIRASQNTTYEDRTATVTIRAEGLSQSITVRQPANLGVVIPTKSYEIASDARTVEVEVKSNVEYKVTVSESWIKQTGTKGLTSKTLVFSVEANTTYDPRSATITVKPQSGGEAEQVISVKQAQKDALKVSKATYSMPYGGGEVDVKVEANVEFEVKSGVDWIQYVQTKGLSSSTVVLKVAENKTYKAREGKVVIQQKGGSLKKTITVKQDGRVAVTGITLNKTSVELEKGETVTLKATVKPDNATDKTVTWSSSDKKIAKVSSDGKVTAVAEGTAKITAKAGEKTASCTVTVENKVLKVGDPTTIPAEGGTFEVEIQYNTDYTVEVEQSAQSWITFIQTKALSSGKLQFSFAANESTSPRQGKVTIKDKKGKAAPVTITFKQEENKVLKVGNPTTIPAEGGTFEVEIQYNTDYTVEVEKSAQSWITFIQTKALSSGKLQFSFAANESTEARSGKVTIRDKKGKAESVTITFKQDGCVAVTGVTLNKTNLTLMTGETATLKATVKPDNAPDKTVTWRSNDESVATVSSDGVVTAIAKGTAEVTAAAGGKSAICTVTVNDKVEETIKAALMKIYDAMDGPHWTINKKWDTSQPLEEWYGVRWNEGTQILDLFFEGEFGLKGKFPDCFGDLTQLETIHIQKESGVTGTLPSSFKKLKNLKSLSIYGTSMTSLPDIFEGLPLKHVNIGRNSLMTGPLPESLGSSPELDYLSVGGNAFSGKVPDSWARLGTGLELQEASLDERVPDSFVQSADADYLVNMYITMTNWRTAPVVVGDYDIPAYWPRRDIKDVVTGKTIDYKKIVSKNKVTVLLNWATWCPFSKDLMPVLKRMYDKYHGDGLEIIAAYNADEEGKDQGKPLKEGILERKYDKWYNFDIWNFSGTEWNIWCSGTPSAILVDNKGMTLASGKENISDPARGRFGYAASTHLIPLLEDIFGPLDEDEDYSSTDYSKDGEVMTLQKATKGKGINLVFMGDAYTDRDMGKGGLYESLMEYSMEEFFAIEPYKTFRDRFNVYAVKVVSKNGRTGDGYTTALGSVATMSSISTGNTDKCYEYALKVPGIKNDKNLVIGVLVNSSTSARGICVMSESKQSGVGYYGSTGNDRKAFGGTIRHEVGGHGFAFLDDEYETEQGSATQEHIDFRNTMYKKYGWYSNVDFTNDPKKVKWSAFLSDSRYKDEVGIYEGGSLYSKGAYRPSDNSMMRHNYEYYNAPSRWAIYQRIMKLSGEDYSFESFLKYDAVNRGNTGTKAGSQPSVKIPEGWQPGEPPVVIP